MTRNLLVIAAGCLGALVLLARHRGRRADAEAALWAVATDPVPPQG